ncbi:MAG: SMC-Scp complex subunit ScpB [bacterium]|nr:SMC-Scp complex subunit ScpB [bacterium]
MKPGAEEGGSKSRFEPQEANLPEGFEEGVSLEELSQSYANVLADATSASSASLAYSDEAGSAQGSPESERDPIVNDGADDELTPTPNTPIAPISIVEAILFVGDPDGAAIPRQVLADLIRGVSESEIGQLAEELNRQYSDSDSAFRVVEHPEGLRLELHPEMESIRERFYERSRPVTLNQAAIDCLALIAYQPGISKEALEQQRGQSSGSILNQLVRRQLIEIRRVDVSEERGPKSRVAQYYPTDKLLELAGLSAWEDLPQVEELELD